MTEIRMNFQQVPKTPGYLSNYVARPGFKLVQLDYASLEPKIVAAFSQDETLIKLYGPGAKPNDVYLFTGAHIELFKDEIRKYYDPENPTAESIADAKKYCKKLRAFNKCVHLACGYGASVNRVRSILIMQGFPVTIGEARIIHRDYWKLYAGIKRFESELQAVWQDTGGWIPSLAGKPICVPADYLHDIVNRFAQTSGHEVLMMLVHNIETLRRQRKIEMYPWIPDFHDETIWETQEYNVPAVVQLFNDAMTMVNERLEMNVMMSGEPQIADNLAEIKCEDYHEWKRLQGGI